MAGSAVDEDERPQRMAQRVGHADTLKVLLRHTVEEVAQVEGHCEPSADVGKGIRHGRSALDEPVEALMPPLAGE